MNTRFFLFFAVLCISACEPVIDSRGYNPDKMDITKIKVNKTTKEDVRSCLGSPSVIGDIESGTVWYYIAKKTETTSFFKPKILEEDVLKITFNNKGIVQKIIKMDKLDGVDLEADKTRTSSTGYEESVATSLFDDFNRMFGQPKKKKTEEQA
ncbi:MAG: outer membrane protein assembly factor BamE [Proteobacteria bacterium]|nr:outer membrane protein assembly factor BamE [Pseudomonadota bacterium]